MTTYGNKLDIYVFACEDRHKDEKAIHRYFKDYNLSGEIFDKKYLAEYVEYCNSRFTLIYPFTMTIKNKKFMRDELKIYDKLEITQSIDKMSDKIKSKRTLSRIEEKKRKKLLDEIKEKNYNHIKFDLKKLDKNEFVYMYNNMSFETQFVKENEDEKYLITSDFVYRNKIYPESQYKYGVNSVTILTGEIYGNIFGFNVDNAYNTMNRYKDVCVENKFKGHTITMDGINHERILYFRPNERQTNGLRGRDLSKIKLFDVDIDAYYNGQHIHGPTVLDYNGEIVRCEFVIESVQYGVAPLPDFIYDEIIRQLNKDLETSVNKKECHTNHHPNKISEFERPANENEISNEFVFSTNSFDMTNNEHIKFCESYLNNVKVLSINSIKMYCETYLIFTTKKEDEIKGTELVEHCAEQLGYISLLPQKIYPFLDDNGLSYRILNGMRYFIYVKFRNPYDYDRH
jgi:hypothetical protein